MEWRNQGKNRKREGEKSDGKKERDSVRKEASARAQSRKISLGLFDNPKSYLESPARRMAKSRGMECSRCQREEYMQEDAKIW